jgi:hypothetical protein
VSKAKSPVCTRTFVLNLNTRGQLRRRTTEASGSRSHYRPDALMPLGSGTTLRRYLRSHSRKRRIITPQLCQYWNKAVRIGRYGEVAHCRLHNHIRSSVCAQRRLLTQAFPTSLIASFDPYLAGGASEVRLHASLAFLILLHWVNCATLNVVWALTKKCAISK